MTCFELCLRYCQSVFGILIFQFGGSSSSAPGAVDRLRLHQYLSVNDSAVSVQCQCQCQCQCQYQRQRSISVSVSDGDINVQSQCQCQCQ